MVIVPELEEWLWHNPSSLSKVLKAAPEELSAWTKALSRPGGPDAASTPKELFDGVCRRRLGRTAFPREFEKIANSASLKSWCKSQSFAALVQLLREWFPM